MTMQLKGVKIAGVPATKVRDALRRAWEMVKPHYFCETLGVGERRAREITRTLVEMGILRRERSRRELWYVITAAGNSFKMARATKRMPLAKGATMLAALLDRVREANNRDYAYRVESVVVFGSYVRGEETIGDLDVAVELADRLPRGSAEWRAAHDRRVELALDQGREFGSYVAELNWPHEEVMLFLKNRQSGLSLISWCNLPTLAKDHPEFNYQVAFGNPEHVRQHIEAA